MRGSRTTSGRGSSWAFELAVSALLSSCSQGRPVVLVEVRPREGQSLDKARLERRAVGTIERIPGFRFRHKRKGETAWQYTVTIDLLTERTSDRDAALVHRAAGVRGELQAIGAATRYDGSALESEDVDPKASIEHLVERAIDRAAADLATALELTDASDAAVLDALGDPDPVVRSRAIAIAGSRKLSAAVAPLQSIVRDETMSEELVIKAVGSLVAIGDPAATSVIIEVAKRSPAHAIHIVFAVGQLGGREAEGYLFTVESGHPDPSVRQAAAQALEELERRRGEKATPPP
jgi:hypothetical protein